MDIATVASAVLSSGVVSLGAARWLTTRLVDHRLAKDLKNHQENLDEKLATSKSQLDERLASVKAEVEAGFRRRVEEYLGDKAAERQYRQDARKRLYTAIGPLRFQLVTACAEFANRVDRIGRGSQPYQTSLQGYFGRSTVFRLLRLFAITELIERQMSQADFSVDPSTVDLLRFKQAAFRCISSSTVSLDHPKVNWSEQIEHVFHDTLSIIAAAMVVNDIDSKQARAMRFDEFNRFVSDAGWLTTIHPVPRLVENFSPSTKPILWVRLVALGQLCNAFVTREGPAVGISPESFDGTRMLGASTDEYLVAQRDRYHQVLQDVAVTIPVPANIALEPSALTKA